MSLTWFKPNSLCIFDADINNNFNGSGKPSGSNVLAGQSGHITLWAFFNDFSGIFIILCLGMPVTKVYFNLHHHLHWHIREYCPMICHGKLMISLLANNVRILCEFKMVQTKLSFEFILASAASFVPRSGGQSSHAGGSRCVYVMISQWRHAY